MYHLFLNVALSILLLHIIKAQDIISGIWNDDFNYDANGLVGWRMYTASQRTTNTIPLGNRIVQGYRYKYHGYFNVNTQSQYNIITRKFKCSSDSDIYVSYSFNFCRTEPSDYWHLYSLDAPIIFSGDYVRSDNMPSYSSCVDCNNFASYEQGTMWNRNLQIDISYKCDTSREYNYKTVQNQYMGWRTGNTPFTITLRSDLSHTSDYTFLWDFQIHCDAPTAAPTIAPTLSPTTPPTNAPSESPTLAPTLSPTTPPTNAPTIAPSYPPGFPTPAPTLTQTYVYVTSVGCDYGDCGYGSTNYVSSCVNQMTQTDPQYNECCNRRRLLSFELIKSHNEMNPPTLPPTCKTINYAWKCFLGEIEGNPPGSCINYDANGVFTIDEGIWNFPHNLNFADNNIIIRGAGVDKTTWRYNGNEATWIMCRWPKCWLSLQDLTIASNRIGINDRQLYMPNGGTLLIKNVIFDGNNFNVNRNGKAFWEFIDHRVKLFFYDCYFTNIDAMFVFSNDVTALFSNCIFDSNAITLNTGLSQNDGMFFINNSNITFQDCMFSNNIHRSRPLFIIQNKATVQMNNVTFFGNVAIDLVHNTDMITLNSNESMVNIINCKFIQNVGYHALIHSINDYQWDNNKLECIGQSQAANIKFISSGFENNNVSYLLLNKGKNVFIDNVTFFEANVCNEHCLSSLDASIQLDGYYWNVPSNFLRFQQSVKAMNNVSLCISNQGNEELASEIFSFNISKRNSKIIYGDCLQPWTLNYFVHFGESNVWPTEVAVFDIPGALVDKKLACVQNNVSKCDIYCNSTVSCFGSTMFVDKKHTNILCDSKSSCQNSIITATRFQYINISLHIICHQESSCKNAYIVANGIKHFKMECFNIESCTDTTINISSTTKAEISCYEQNACDNIQVLTDYNNIVFTLHKFSKNIKIHNNIGFTGNNLICGENDAYIILNNQYDTPNKSLSKTLYNPLPCDDVQFICNKINSCTIQQTLNFPTNSLNFDLFTVCYGPILYTDINEIDCVGTCPNGPTTPPTYLPTKMPTIQPTKIPTAQPTKIPTIQPTKIPTTQPTKIPTTIPTIPPTDHPSISPTSLPSQITLDPTVVPSVNPTTTIFPTVSPLNPSPIPSDNPTITPTLIPSEPPSIYPTSKPTAQPIMKPTLFPSASPSTVHPTINPTHYPTLKPTLFPSESPSIKPTSFPTTHYPTLKPTIQPIINPTIIPTIYPSTQTPSFTPTKKTTLHPTFHPSINPTAAPISSPSNPPSHVSTTTASQFSSTAPTIFPSLQPSWSPSSTTVTTSLPSITPKSTPSIASSISSTLNPSDVSSTFVTEVRTINLTDKSIQSTIIMSTNSQIAETITEEIPIPKNVELAHNTFWHQHLFLIVGSSILIMVLFIVICTLCVFLIKFKNQVTTIKAEKIPQHDFDLNDLQIGNINPMSNLSIKNDIIEEQKQQNGILVNENEKNINYSQISNDSDKNESESEQLYVPVAIDDETKMEIEMLSCRSNILNQPKKKKIKQNYLKSWFHQKIKIPSLKNSYYEIFVDNGYETIEIVQLLTEDKLRKMGIKKQGHIDKIMMEINGLKRKMQSNETEGINITDQTTDTNTQNTS